MAGRCAERLVLGEANTSTAGSADLAAANRIAREMVFRCGFRWARGGGLEGLAGSGRWQRCLRNASWRAGCAAVQPARRHQPLPSPPASPCLPPTPPPRAASGWALCR